MTDVLCAFCLSFYQLGLGLVAHQGKSKINTQNGNGFLFHINRHRKLLVQGRHSGRVERYRGSFQLTAPVSLNYDSWLPGKRRLPEFQPLHSYPRIQNGERGGKMTKD